MNTETYDDVMDLLEYVKDHLKNLANLIDNPRAAIRSADRAIQRLEHIKTALRGSVD